MTIGASSRLPERVSPTTPTTSYGACAREDEVLSKWVFTSPEPPGHRLTDNHDSGRLRIVCPGEIAAAHHRYSVHAEKPRRDDVPFRQRSLSQGHELLPFGQEVSGEPPPRRVCTRSGGAAGEECGGEVRGAIANGSDAQLAAYTDL